MNRYPNLVGASGALLSARSNGFLRRKIFPVAGSFSFTLPDDLPTDDRGLIRVMGWVLGGGSGGNDGNVSGGTNAGGTGGGFSQKELWVPPESVFSVIVGAPGPKKLSGNNISGGLSSITIDGKTWQATGGQTAAGGVGSGGDINTDGGTRVQLGSNVVRMSGASAGSPWGNGSPGVLSDSGSPAGAKWRIPKFWDITDPVGSSLFEFISSIGAGADGGTGGLGDPTPEAAWGGGGPGGWQNAGQGGSGLALIYW